MPAFEAAGRTWSVEFNVAALKRCRRLLDFDLLAVFPKANPDDVEDPDRARELLEPLAAFVADPERVVDALFVVLEPDLEAAGLDDVAFGTAMAGAAIEDACWALLESVAEFFPNAVQRRAAGLLVSKARETTAALTPALMETLEAADRAFDPSAIASEFSDSAVSSPGSSESTPTDGRSASSSGPRSDGNGTSGK